MDSKTANKKDRIKEIFENMNYDKDAKESCELATEWMKKYNNKFYTSSDVTKKETEFCSDKIGVNEVQNDSDVEKLIKESCGGVVNSPTSQEGIQQTKLLNKLATEIEKNSSLICQLELKIRNIFIKDTKNAISTFVEYFQYYAGWASIMETKSNEPGICVFSLSKSTPLPILGMVLAACLPTFNGIILSVEKELIPLCFLIKELCTNAKLPNKRINIVNGSLQNILQNSKVTSLTYIGDLFDKKFTEMDILESVQLTTLHLGKGTMLIFDTSDLDSAVEFAADSVLSYRGLYPWSVNKILVQESVFEIFQGKFLSKYESLGASPTACPKNQDTMKYSVPEIKFGYKTAGSNVLSNDQNNELNILPFRTANEAVSLANNTRLGLAVSVWTENINLAFEVTSKLQFGTIWINNHGYFNPACSFMPFKKSGTGYFGGKEGLLQYKLPEPVNVSRNCPEKNQFLYCNGSFTAAENPNKEDAKNIIENAMKVQESWKKLESKSKAQHLRKFADNCSTVQNCEKFVDSLYKWSMLVHATPSENLGSPSFITIKEPMGVIAMEFYDDTTIEDFRLIIAAIACGNALIIINRAKNDELIKNICEKCTLPPGVLNVISCAKDKEIINFLKAHPFLSTFFSDPKEKVKIYSHLKTRNVSSVKYKCDGGLFQAVMTTKCIWNSIGESF